MISSRRIFNVFDTPPLINGLPADGNLRLRRVLMLDLKWRIKRLTGWQRGKDEMVWRAWDLPVWDRLDKRAIQIYKYTR